MTNLEIIFGSGLFGFLIIGIRNFIRKYQLKRRLTKEISFELFANEIFTEGAIENYQKLQQDPLVIMPYWKFYNKVTNAVLLSGYFINLNFKLVQLIIQLSERFRNVQNMLIESLTITNEQKKINAFLLPTLEEDARLLLKHLQESKIFKKLKKKYYPKWNKARKKEFEERHNLKVKKD